MASQIIVTCNAIKKLLCRLGSLGEVPASPALDYMTDEQTAHLSSIWSDAFLLPRQQRMSTDFRMQVCIGLRDTKRVVQKCVLMLLSYLGIEALIKAIVKEVTYKEVCKWVQQIVAAGDRKLEGSALLVGIGDKTTKSPLLDLLVGAGDRQTEAQSMSSTATIRTETSLNVSLSNCSKERYNLSNFQNLSAIHF